MVSLLIRTLTLSDQGPTLRTSFYLNYLLKALFPSTVTLRVRASIPEFGGTQFSLILSRERWGSGGLSSG